MDGGEAIGTKHFIFGLLEVDITDVRRRLRELNRTGEHVSFISWVVKAVGDSVANNREVQAMLTSRNKLVVFEDVDIALPVEKTVDGRTEPFPVLIRAANRMSVQEINEQIQQFKARHIQDGGEFVSNDHNLPGMAQWIYYHLPKPIRTQILRRLFHSPLSAKRYSGTVFVTTVNAVGKVSGWSLPTRSMCNLTVAIGSITKKPWIVKDQIVAREIMNLTVAMNHDVIDGVPARRFVQDLVNRIQICPACFHVSAK